MPAGAAFADCLRSGIAAPKLICMPHPDRSSSLRTRCSASICATSPLRVRPLLARRFNSRVVLLDGRGLSAAPSCADDDLPKGRERDVPGLREIFGSENSQLPGKVIR